MVSFFLSKEQGASLPVFQFLQELVMEMHFSRFYLSALNHAPLNTCVNE
jgi:hypothetical protein